MNALLPEAELPGVAARGRSVLSGIARATGRARGGAVRLAEELADPPVDHRHDAGDRGAQHRVVDVLLSDPDGRLRVAHRALRTSMSAGRSFCAAPLSFSAEMTVCCSRSTDTFPAAASTSSWCFAVSSAASDWSTVRFALSTAVRSAETGSQSPAGTC